jgi:hypothetical protein
MKWLRLRLSTLLWLVALVAVFLGGIRYGEHREATRRLRLLHITLTSGESREFELKLKPVRPVKPRTGP